LAYEVKAPNPYHTEHLTVFLGGAIDMGKAHNWQQEVVEAMHDLEVTILNPRREDWPDEADEFLFNQQVMWEIAAQDAADLRVYVFTKKSKAPISMFEFGAWGIRKDSIICVEEGFYREGNLLLYSRHFKVPVYTNLEEFITDLHEVLKEKLHPPKA
jgi:hypothetical protein